MTLPALGKAKAVLGYTPLVGRETAIEHCQRWVAAGGRKVTASSTRANGRAIAAQPIVPLVVVRLRGVMV